jgi:hypothetical protein
MVPDHHCDIEDHKTLLELVTNTMFSNVPRFVTHDRIVRRSLRSFATFPAPRLFDYDTIVKNLCVADALESVEQAFGALARGGVEVPMPM